MSIPLFYIVLLLSTGIIIGRYNINQYIILFLFSLSIILSIYFYFRNKNVTFLILLAFFLLGIYMGNNTIYYKSTYDKMNDKLISLEGTVSNLKDDNGYSKYILKPRNGEKVLITQSGGKAPNDGDFISVRGIVNKPNGKRNPGGFDYRLYLRKIGVYATMKVNYYAVKILKSDSDSKLNIFIRSIRNKIKENYNRTMPEQDAKFVSSVILGENDVDEVTLNSFRVTGISHIIAVSGFNFGLLTVFMIYLLALLHIKRFSTPIVIPVLILYTMITGSPPSAIRSVIMACMVLIASSIGRENNPLNSISFAAIIILLINPLMLYDIGFQLSFVATLAIIYLYNPIKNKLNIKSEKLKEAISLTIAAQIGTIPIVLYFFHNISLISIIPNIIIVPLVSITVIIGFLSIIFGFILPYLAFLLNVINIPIVEIVLFLTKIFGSIPFASINVPIPPLYIILLYYVLILVAISSLDKNRKIKMGALISIITVTLVFINLIIPKGLDVTFLDVGQGDSTYVETPHRSKILIDGGGSMSFNGEASFDVGQNILLPYLYYKNADSLDAIFISHTDYDHIGGILTILGNINVKKIFIGKQVQNDKNYEELLKLVHSRGIPLIELSKDDVVSIDNIIFTILNPGENSIQENAVNNNALVFKMSYKDVDILFTGDIERPTEDVLKNMDIDSEVLKVPHHGSSTSSSKEFIDKVNPKISIIEVGKNNYGQPNKDVIEYLSRKSKLYRTDLDGAILMNTNGKKISIKKMAGM